MAGPAKTRRKRSLAQSRDQAIEQALSLAVRQARRRAAAEGVPIPVQKWGEAKVRWVKP